MSVLAESLAFGPWGSIEARTLFLSVLTSRRPRIALNVEMSIGKWNRKGKWDRKGKLRGKVNGKS